MTDPLSGEEVDVLWVKGSGGDLRTSTRANFASLYMDKFLSLENIYNKADVKGVKTEIEDSMVDMYRHATFGLNPATGSIDTPLHGLIPFRHVDHMHPISAIAIAASKGSGRTHTGSIWWRGRAGFRGSAPALIWDCDEGRAEEESQPQGVDHGAAWSY
jgi:rhamnose utilization protein RhaD (predicted bifunctional aldolase and dehydrogenase)